MIFGDKNVILSHCLKTGSLAFENDSVYKPIILFELQSIKAIGCSSNSDLADYEIKGMQLTTFDKNNTK